MNTQQQTAYHEAGHCVIAHAVGRRYGAALHDNGGGLAGPGDLSEPAKASSYTMASMEPYYKADTLPALLDDAAISAAGCAAVAMASCSPVVILSGPDRVMVEAAGRAAFPGIDSDGLRHWEGLALCRARSLMARWKAVESIADALLAQGKLTADEVSALITNQKGDNQ